MNRVDEQQLTRMEELRADLAALRDELREVVTQGHQVLAEGRQQLKDLNEATARARAAVPEAVEDEIAAELGARLEEMGGHIKAVQDKALTKVVDEFETLTGMLMGRSATARRSHLPSLHEVVEMASRPAPPPDILGLDLTAGLPGLKTPGPGPRPPSARRGRKKR